MGIVKWRSLSLTHWGWVKHICVCNLTIIGSYNGLSPGRCQAIICTNAGILWNGPLGTNFSEILIKIHIFSLKEIHLKMSWGKWRPFCLGASYCSMSKGLGLSKAMQCSFPWRCWRYHACYKWHFYALILWPKLVILPKYFWFYYVWVLFVKIWMWMASNKIDTQTPVKNTLTFDMKPELNRRFMPALLNV